MFFRLESPAYGSDYKDTFINGGGKYAYSLPGIECSECGNTWGGWETVPYPCPETMKGDKRLQQHWPIPDTEHHALRAAVLDAVVAEGHSVNNIPMGANFQPLHVRFPSTPRSDFLWPVIGSAIVSPRVKLLFETHGVTGVTFCEVVIDKVGKRDSRGPFPFPSTGEPEDIIEEVSGEQFPDRFGPLYEMVITSESGFPPGVSSSDVCTGCTRENYKENKRRIVLTQEMIPNSDVFTLATTLYIIVNERVQHMIVENRLTNAVLTSMPIESNGKKPAWLRFFSRC